MTKSDHESARQLAVYRRLAEVSVHLNSALEFDQLLLKIIDAAVEVLDAERASILLYDEHANELRFKASSGCDASQFAAIPVPLDASIAGSIFRDNQPTIVADVNKDPRHFNKVAEVTGLPAESLIGVPMRVKSRVIGVLEAMNKRHGEFNQDDLEVFSILADQAAVAIHDAQVLDELKKAHARLGELERMKGAFVAIASHELRTPLFAILGFAELLRDAQGESAKYAQRIVGSAVQMRNLIEDLTNLRHLQAGLTPAGHEQADMRELLADVCQEMQSLVKAKAQRLHLDNTTELLPVHVDRLRMTGALTKLFANAVSFTPEGGQINVLSTRKANEGWVQIEDTGPGIAPGREEDIFESFCQLEDYLTRTHEGMGLGLSIARGMVELHGGRLWAENILPGPGSRFTAVLPLATTT